MLQNVLQDIFKILKVDTSELQEKCEAMFLKNIISVMQFKNFQFNMQILSYA